MCSLYETDEDRDQADYSQMTNEEFDEILGAIVQEEGSDILSVGEVYTALADRFNNEILKRWADVNEEKAYPGESSDE